jgi:hypothetical protein
MAHSVLTENSIKDNKSRVLTYTELFLEPGSAENTTEACEHIMELTFHIHV